jgi:hypothetical protein
MPIDVILNKHVRDRMRDRRVSIEEIRYVLEGHSFSAPGQNGSLQLERSFETGRTLKVWIVGSLPVQGRVIIKSVAWKGEDDG